MAVSGDFLRLAAIVIFVLVALLLWLADGFDLRDALALDSIGLAAFAASAITYVARRP